jgi:hypothetical protein
VSASDCCQFSNGTCSTNMDLTSCSLAGGVHSTGRCMSSGMCQP